MYYKLQRNIYRGDVLNLSIENHIRFLFILYFII